MGLLGVLIIIRPGLGVIQPASVVALVAVALYALYQVLTRMVGRVDAAETSLLWQLGVGSAALSFVVRSPGARRRSRTGRCSCWWPPWAGWATTP